MQASYVDPHAVREVAPTISGPLPADVQPLRWGPIWGGLLVALGVFFLLTLAAIAVGIQAAPGTASQQNLGIVAVITTSVIALVAFFVGGFISSWSGELSDPGRSMLNGFLVWALSLVGILLLAAVGLGSLVGAMGQLFGDVLPGSQVDPAKIVDVLKGSAWQTLLALGLTAASATLGGAVGAHEELRARWRVVR